MSRVFNISSATDAVALDGSGRGSVTFTVTNASGRVLRGRLKIKPLDALGADAIAIEGESERTFNPNDTQQVSVRITAPAGMQAGKYRFRLDGVSVDNPDEDFTEGPALAVEVKATPAPSKGIPWWVYAVAVLVLAVGGTIGYLVMHKGGSVDLIAVSGPYDEAKQKLEALGLVVARREEPTAAAPPGQVLKQAPTPAEQPKVKKGSTVTLTVAAPPAGPAMVDLPQVTETSYDEASKQLQGLGLVVRRLDRPTATFAAGQVIGQTPKASQVAKGSTVTLTVAVPPPNPFVGTWVSRDTNPDGIKRLVIEQDGSAFRIHPSGKCFSQKCDWGTQEARQVGNRLVASWNSAGAEVRMDMIVQDNELRVSADYHDILRASRSEDLLVRQIIDPRIRVIIPEGVLTRRAPVE